MAAMWGNSSVNGPNFFFFQQNQVCLASPRGPALSGQLISCVCNISSAKQEIINVPIKSEKGQQSRVGVLLASSGGAGGCAESGAPISPL